MADIFIGKSVVWPQKASTDPTVSRWFVQASGQTKALVTLKTTDLRSVVESDILAVRTA